MNGFLQLQGFLFAAIVFFTSVAQSFDHPVRQIEPGAMAFLRHHLNKIGLLALVCGSFMCLLMVLTSRPLPFPLFLMMGGVALRQITHHDSWWAFVWHGIPYQSCSSWKSKQ